MSVFDDLERAVNHLREYGDEPRRIVMPKECYDRIDPSLIAEKEREFNCEIVSVERKVYKPERKRVDIRLRAQDAMRFHKRGRKNKRK